MVNPSSLGSVATGGGGGKEGKKRERRRELEEEERGRKKKRRLEGHEQGVINIKRRVDKQTR